MKYMIHACPERLWYVEDFLKPSMVKQGIAEDDIIIWNDAEKKGNLQSWLESCEYIKENHATEKGLWHIQDDALLSDGFREEAEKAEYKIINGFVSLRYNPRRNKFVGENPVLRHWNSFLCMYIPNRNIIGFLSWYKNIAVHEEVYRDVIASGKNDDYLFWAYMRRQHHKDTVINLAPNIADHIDYLIGGSVANSHREGIATAVYFDPAKLDSFKAELGKYREKKEQEKDKQEDAPVKRSKPRKSPSNTEKVESIKTAPKPRKTANRKPVKAEEKKA